LKTGSFCYPFQVLHSSLPWHFFGLWSKIATSLSSKSNISILSHLRAGKITNHWISS
jgi:hypothetical protein